MADDVDVLVIGGGMLGMCVALLASEADKSVAVCRLSDRHVPHADSLRNQSWLQSGLRYLRSHDLPFALRMLKGGQELHDQLAVPRPSGFGITRLRDPAEGNQLEELAASMGVVVRRLPDNETKIYLGALFEADSTYYATPEIPFDEALLLNELRQIVLSRGLVREIERPAELVMDASGRWDVSIDGTVLTPPWTVLAAGAGNVPLLKTLGSEDLKIDKTPLMVLPLALLRGTQIFVDKLRGVSIVSHPPSPRLPAGASVVGVGGCTVTDTAFVSPSERRIDPLICDLFKSRLPPALSRHVAGGRFTAGFEVSGKDAGDARPWIKEFDESRLVAAIPGRATLSMSVAKDVLSHLSAASRPLNMPGAAWKMDIYMHHEPHYSHLNDADAVKSGV